MLKIEFYINFEDLKRLFAIQREQGKDDLTGNEFARELFEKELHRLHPRKVEFDECGNEI